MWAELSMHQQLIGKCVGRGEVKRPFYVMPSLLPRCSKNFFVYRWRRVCDPPQRRFSERSNGLFNVERRSPNVRKCRKSCWRNECLVALASMDTAPVDFGSPGKFWYLDKLYVRIQYCNHLNTRQVRYSNGPSVSSCWMAQILNGGLKTGQKIYVLWP